MIGKTSPNKTVRNTIVSFGEILWDILPTETVLGGAPFNFIYRVDSLGHRGTIISRLGRDELGRQAVDRINELALDTSCLQWDDQHTTGRVQVSFDAEHNPSYVIVPHVAYDHIEPTDMLTQAVSQADCICFGTLIQRSDQSRKTLRQLLAVAPDSLKLLDINLRRDCYSPETVTSSLQKADILKLNRDELNQLSTMLEIGNGSVPDFGHRIMEKYSLRYCFVTLGAMGVFALSDRNEQTYVPGHKVTLVDSLGAGDAFTAGALHCLMQDQPLVEACAFGNVLGAIVCGQRGATQPITTEQVEAFGRKNTERIVDPRLAAFAA